MTSLKTVLQTACILLFAIAVQAQAPAGGATGARGRGPAGPGLTLRSPDFSDGGVIPDKFTQAVSNPVSPELDWTHVPAGTVTFALITDDLDTALQHSANEVLHWMAFNIPGSSTQLQQGVPTEVQLPDGTVQAQNSGRHAGFMGPGAPAAGPDHHYAFQLFALDEKLSLGPDATRQQVIDAMQGHILGKGVLVGRFHRPQSPPIQ